MKLFKIINSILFVAAAAFAQSSLASVVFSFGTPNGTEIGSGFGNTYSFTDSSGLSVDVTSFGLTANGGTEFEAAQVGQFFGGLGSCNTFEGLGCNSPLHTADNIGQKEVLVMAFNQQVDFSSVELTNFGTDNNYVDIEYWIGTAPIPVALAGSTASNTTKSNDSITTISGFGESTYSFEYVGFQDIASFDLTPGTGNVLIIGATFGDPFKDGNNDRFKLSSVTVTAVPIPAAAWLFGSALIGMSALKRRK